MTTVGANFVSTQFLANSLVGPVMQAQSSLTTAMTEELTGQYADLGLQLGDQSGYELSLKEQVGLLQTLTIRQQRRFDQLVDRAERALGHPVKRPDDPERPGDVDAERKFRRLASEHGPIGAAVAHRLDQCDVGGSICVRRNQFRRRADGGLLFDPHVGRQDRN